MTRSPLRKDKNGGEWFATVATRQRHDHGASKSVGHDSEAELRAASCPDAIKTDLLVAQSAAVGLGGGCCPVTKKICGLIACNVSFDESRHKFPLAASKNSAINGQRNRSRRTAGLQRRPWNSVIRALWPVRLAPLHSIPSPPIQLGGPMPLELYKSFTGRQRPQLVTACGSISTFEVSAPRKRRRS
jgi:hypothetical protein